MPTKQETFDRVARHLLAQGRRSAVNGECKYRGPNDTKCAAGALIPDERYHSRMEGICVGIVDTPDFWGDCSLLTAGRAIMEEGHDIVLVDDLQMMHDTERPAYWTDALRKVAGLHGLDSSVVDLLDSK